MEHESWNELEHLPEPDLLLAELHRVLTPEGRVYASVPNDWSDETGEDPNPFHFHVYDWPRLLAQFDQCPRPEVEDEPRAFGVDQISRAALPWPRSG